MAEQCSLAYLSLPAAVIPTATKLAMRLHRHVSNFGAYASHTAEYPPIMHNSTAKSDASADVQHFVIVLRRTEVMFAQSCDICLVIHDERSLREGLLQYGTNREWFFPAQVGRIQHRSGGLIDQSRDAYPDTQERPILLIAPLDGVVQKHLGMIEDRFTAQTRVRMLLV